MLTFIVNQHKLDLRLMGVILASQNCHAQHENVDFDCHDAHFKGNTDMCPKFYGNPFKKMFQ